MLQSEPDPILQDLLENAAIDLATYSGPHSLLTELLSLPYGKWHEITTLRENLVESSYYLQQLDPKLAAEIFVSWCDLPGNPNSPNKLVIFLQASSLWSKAFVCNSETILNKKLS